MGWAGLVLILGVRAYLYHRNEQWIETTTFPLAVAALTPGPLRLADRSWAALPAIVFLWLMLPMPPSLSNLLAGPLQSLATAGSTALLQIMGLPVVSEGNTILIGASRLEVARAPATACRCS